MYQRFAPNNLPGGAQIVNHFLNLIRFETSILYFVVLRFRVFELQSGAAECASGYLLGVAWDPIHLQVRTLRFFI